MDTPAMVLWLARNVHAILPRTIRLPFLRQGSQRGARLQPRHRELDGRADTAVTTNFCPVCLGSVCTTCGHPTPMHIQDSDGKRSCTVNTPEGCDCKADPRDHAPILRAT